MSSAPIVSSARRLLQSIANAVFPPHTQAFVDSRGKKHDVGADDYKNRLLAFIDQRLSSRAAVVRRSHGAEIEAFSSRIDALYEKASKGVHATITVDEVRLVVISAYLVLAEVVQLATESAPTDGPALEVAVESDAARR